MLKKINNKEISIIGGAGHVGFPLGLIFSAKNFKVNLIDKNSGFLNKIERGIPPFLEKGSKKASFIANNNLKEIHEIIGLTKLI